MYSLIVEDDFISRNIMQKILSEFGDCDIAVNGQEAVDAFELAWKASEPYDLICMDIMMPVLDGQEALRKIRQVEIRLNLEDYQKVKVIMTTALNDKKEVVDAFYQGGASSYFVKPIEVDDFISELKILGLLEGSPEPGRSSQAD